LSRRQPAVARYQREAAGRREGHNSPQAASRRSKSSYSIVKDRGRRLRAARIPAGMHFRRRAAGPPARQTFYFFLRLLTPIKNSISRLSSPPGEPGAHRRVAGASCTGGAILPGDSALPTPHSGPSPQVDGRCSAGGRAGRPFPCRHNARFRNSITHRSRLALLSRRLVSYDGVGRIENRLVSARWPSLTEARDGCIGGKAGRQTPRMEA